jgi:hypothetical protein
LVWRIFEVLRDRVRREPGQRSVLLIQGPLAIVFMLFGWMVAGLVGLFGVVATVAASVA